VPALNPSGPVIESCDARCGHSFLHVPVEGYSLQEGKKEVSDFHHSKKYVSQQNVYQQHNRVHVQKNFMFWACKPSTRISCKWHMLLEPASCQ
jgi:hypothetical protein